MHQSELEGDAKRPVAKMQQSEDEVQEIRHDSEITEDEVQ